MEKMFVHIAKKSSFSDALKLKYAKSIVFINDTGEIFTHGKYYSISSEWQDKITNAKNQLDALQNAVQALQEIHPFTSISDGTHIASATADAKTIKFKATGKASVSVDNDGVTISASGTTLTKGPANGETSVDGVSPSTCCKPIAVCHNLPFPAWKVLTGGCMSQSLFQMDFVILA